MLGRTWKAQDNGEGLPRGPTAQHAIWVNRVPEAKTVKHRVHLDIYARDLADLEALGATIVEPRHGTRGWTIMADPEGGEFCAFLRPEVPAERLHGPVMDSAAPEAQARWWAGVYRVGVTANDDGFTVEGMPGIPILTMNFVPGPEPKTVKNRIHLDVTGPGVQLLIEAGGIVLREPGGRHRMARAGRPEGTSSARSPGDGSHQLARGTWAPCWPSRCCHRFRPASCRASRRTGPLNLESLEDRTRDHVAVTGPRIRTLAWLTKPRGAKRGANDPRSRATSGHIQPLPVRASGTSGHIWHHPAIL